MSELAKTITFVAAAAGSLLLAFAVNTSIDQFDVDSLIGERLNQFGVEEPKRLKIVKFDNETASTREFEVAAKDNLWTIPSKQNYPADAAQQMAEAATCLIDREVLRVAAKDASQHQELGVVDPNSSNLDSKAEGVGTRVTMTNIDDGTLTDMIIGKPVKDSEGLYHIRSVDQDVVYVVELNPDKLTTRFEDWIEDDLLKLNPLDIRNVLIKDYSAEMQTGIENGRFVPRVAWDRRGEFDLSYDDSDSNWHADSLQQYDAEKKEMVPFTLAEDEELNSDVLTEFRTGLDDLLLVDVERKPEGLSADLKAGEGFLDNQEAIESLMTRGFAPIMLSEDGEAEILSSEGEIICTLKDGVEYVLRFGNLKIGGESSSQSTENSAEESEDNSEDSNSGIHRYLFVMARVNETAIEKPEIQDLPALPEENSSEESPAEESPTEDSAEEESAEEESPAEESTDSPAEDEESTAEEPPEDESDEESASEEPSETSEEETTVEETPEEEPATEEEEPVNLEDIIAERKSIEEENQRKLDEYQDNLKAAEERVLELNERFGDWYYVISNDIYKNIHIGRDQLIKTKEEEKEGEEPAATGLPAGGIPGLPGVPAGN